MFAFHIAVQELGGWWNSLIIHHTFSYSFWSVFFWVHVFTCWIDSRFKHVLNHTKTLALFHLPYLKLTVRPWKFTIPQRKVHLPTIIFQGRTISFRKGRQRQVVFRWMARPSTMFIGRSRRCFENRGFLVPSRDTTSTSTSCLLGCKNKTKLQTWDMLAWITLWGDFN